MPVVSPFRDPAHRSALHLYPIQVSDQSTKDRSRVFVELRQSDIGVNVHYIPVHTQPDYQQLGFKPGDFPQAEAYYKRAISLPLYPTLSEAQQNQVVASLRNACSC